MTSYATIIYSPSWLTEYRFEQMILCWRDREGPQHRMLYYSEHTSPGDWEEMLTQNNVPPSLHPALIELQHEIVVDTDNIKRGPGARPFLLNLEIEGDKCQVYNTPFLGIFLLPPPSDEED